MKKVIAVAIFVFLLCNFSIAFANDSAAGIAAGGIQLKNERNVEIEREDLFISNEKIEITYKFKNLSDKDIITEVAFPIPVYSYKYDTQLPDFDSFTVFENGGKIECFEEAKALVKGKNYADILKSMNISIKDFGKYNPEEKTNFFDKLNSQNQAILLKKGLVVSKPEVGWPNWTVSLYYHWKQKFPANRTIEIKHSYKPYCGYEPVSYEARNDFFKESCSDDAARKSVKKFVNNGYFYPEWVSYILRTANNWKRPIKDFHLAVEAKGRAELASFCFEYPLVRKSPKRIEARVKNFIPQKDLKIFFIINPLITN